MMSEEEIKDRVIQLCVLREDATKIFSPVVDAVCEQADISAEIHTLLNILDDKSFTEFVKSGRWKDGPFNQPRRVYHFKIFKHVKNSRNIYMDDFYYEGGYKESFNRAIKWAEAMFKPYGYIELKENVVYNSMSIKLHLPFDDYIEYELRRVD